MDISSLPVIAVSILLSAFFSGMEIAFITANKLRIELLSKQGALSGKILSYFALHPKRFIGTMLIGNNIALVVYGLFMGDLIVTTLGHFVQINSEALLIFIQTLISTAIILVSAEFLPKAIFRINPNRWLELFSIPVAVVFVVLFIPMQLVMGFSRLVLRAFVRGEMAQTEPTFGMVDLDHFLREATDSTQGQDTLDHEIKIFKNALGLAKKKIRDCMVPRNEIVWVEIETPIPEVQKVLSETKFSKLPVCKGGIDNIIGYIHAFDLFKKPESIKNIIRPISIVPEAMPLSEALEDSIRHKKNLTVVMDEFGGTAGIITMEDMVEEIIGEIDDEHDNEQLTEEVLEDNAFLLSARLEIDYLNEKYALGIPENEEYETLAGFILNHAQSIPEAGWELNIDSLSIEITKAGKTKIEEVKLTKKS